MWSKERSANIQSNGSGSTNGGKNIIPSFIPNTSPGVNVAGLEKEKKCKRAKYKTVFSRKDSAARKRARKNRCRCVSTENTPHEHERKSFKPRADDKQPAAAIRWSRGADAVLCAS
jgi:hypothetical protein